MSSIEGLLTYFICMGPSFPLYNTRLVETSNRNNKRSAVSMAS